MIGRLLACGISAGCVAGAVAAVTIPDRAAVAQVPRVPLPALRVAPEPRPSVSTVRLRALPGTLATAAVVADPEGGPRWAVRTFLGERYVSARIRRPGVSPIIGRNLCAQLGRFVDGRFGWIDGENVFRPSAIGYGGGPVLCGSRRPRRPQFDARTVVHLPQGPDARLGPTFAFGAGGTGTQNVRLTVAGAPTRTRSGHLGGFLLLTSARDDQVKGSVAYRGGATAELPVSGFTPPPGIRIAADQRPHPGARPTIDARTPDPNGGPAYGISVVPRRNGGYCVSSSGNRIVEERTGNLDARLGTFTVERFNVLDCGRARFHRSPLVFGYGGGTGDPGSENERARVERRSLPGRFSIQGTARPDVTSITIATPRDVRTLIPGRRSHAFLAAYDGDFPAGEITLTAHLANGGHHVDRIALVF